MAGFLIAAITLALAALLLSSYHNTIAREQTNLRNLAEAFAAQTHYATLALDMVLASDAGRVLSEPNAGARIPARGVREDMAAFVYVLAPGPVPGPAVPSPAPGGPAEVGIGSLAPDSGRGTITLARPLSGRDGHAVGKLVIETDAAYFQHIFDAAELGSGGSVTLLRRDGTMLVRSPVLPGALGRSFLRTPLFQTHLPRMPAGAFETVSPTDGKLRLYGYSEVAGYPMVIITGRDKSDALALWRNWLWVAVAAWALLSVTLALLAWRIGREASRQAALIVRLTDSEKRLAHSFRYLNSILDALPTPLWVLDAQARIVLFNRAFRQFTGQGGQVLAGRTEAEVFEPEGTASRDQPYLPAAADGTRTREVQMPDAAGELRTLIHVAAHLETEEHAVQTVNSLTDITERKRAELRLAYLSDFDLLTGLPNQNYLRRMLEAAVQDAAPHGGQIALIVVALERLQEVADLLGHEAGDEAVRQVAARLRGLPARATCTARVKAGEFGLVLSLGAGQGAVDAFAFEIHVLLSVPVRVCGREFHLAPVVGIAQYPKDARSASELMRLADVARHLARRENGEQVHFHAESTHVQLDERLSIEEQLRHALARGELSAVYQPKIDIATGHVTGFEVLLRWDSPVLGKVSPARFIPIAEQTGLIVPIGNWVLRGACAQASAWRREHGIQVKVAVNLSIRQFYQRDLLCSIEAALAEAGLAPDALELEITESIAMSGVDVVERLLGGIRELGVRLSIDDFGTGYSSLAYLKRFPVQCLKIDRAFVSDLGGDGDSVAIVRTIVALGHGLNMRIIAEGVETMPQLTMLRELGCDECQGYLFARPLDAASVPGWLAAFHEDAASH